MVTSLTREQSGLVYAAFVKGIEEMRMHGVDYVVLDFNVREQADASVCGKFTDLSSTTYYPFEMLTPEEQKLILEGKHYDRLALVLENVGGVITYSEPGIEIYARNRVSWWLPKMDPKSNTNYITEGGVHTDEAMRVLAERAEFADKWTPEYVDQKIKAGIHAYRQKTLELMEQGGVHEALRRMDLRQVPPLEYMKG